jgi:hypothetical protein
MRVRSLFLLLAQPELERLYLTASGISFVLTSLREFDHVFMFVCFPWHFSICITKFFFFQELQE